MLTSKACSAKHRQAVLKFAADLQTLEVVKAEAETLANSVKQTSNLSERVSRKVRELDTAQSRINGTLESIDYIVNRTNAVDGVQQALQTEDYEAAAEYVDTLLQSEEQYGKAHQDSSIKQSEQQSRVNMPVVCLPDMRAGTCIITKRSRAML